MAFFSSIKVSNQNFQHKLATQVCEHATVALCRDSQCLSLTNKVMVVGQRGRAAPELQNSYRATQFMAGFTYLHDR